MPNLVAATKTAAVAPVNFIGRFDHKLVNLLGAACVCIGLLLTNLSYLLADVSFQAALPQAVAILPAKSVFHELGVVLIALGPLITVIRGLRPRKTV